MGKPKEKAVQTQVSDQTMQQSQNTSETGETSGSSTRTPWAAASPLLKSILGYAGDISPGITGAEGGALGLLGNTGNLSAGFLPQLTGLAGDMIGGTGDVGANAAGINKTFNPIAAGEFLDPATNPVIQGAINRGESAARDAVTSRFAGGGRSFSPAEARAMGEGVADVNARTNLSAYNTEIGRQLAAAGILNQTNQGAEASKLAGAGLVPGLTGIEQMPARATLEAEGMRRGIPQQSLGFLSNLVLPIASGFGTTSTEGSSSGTREGSTYGSSTGNTTGTTGSNKGTDWLKTGIGAAIAAAGLATGNPAMAVSGGSTALGSLFGGGNATGAPQNLMPSQLPVPAAGSLY